MSQLIQDSIDCFDDIVWFEPDTQPNATLDAANHNVTRPGVGEVRRVCVRHEHQEPIGGRMWLLFQSGLSLANGFPEPEAELENAAIVEVEILSQTRVPKKKDYWARTQYEAQVRCLRVVGLGQITQVFSSCQPPHWPEANREVQIFETPSFSYVWIISQEIQEWFLLTRTEPPRLILEHRTLTDEPITVCNCEWDWTKWPHRVHKTRR